MAQARDRLIKILSAALEPDYVVLGGGNVRKMKKLPSGTERGNNDKTFLLKSPAYVNLPVPSLSFSSRVDVELSSSILQ
jgi:hypothetical protein